MQNPRKVQVKSLFVLLCCRLDQHGKSEVPQRELIDFEKQYDIPIKGISNLTPGPSPASNTDNIGTELRTNAPILNCLCERLWYRDQQEAGPVIRIVWREGVTYNKEYVSSNNAQKT